MKQKIFIVDDKKPFRETLKHNLKIIGDCEIVAEAETGLEFLEKLKTVSPDLVFMDIEMPDMNGIDATKKALEINKNLAIFGISYYANEEYIDQLMDAGARGYLLKLSNNFKILKEILENPHKKNVFSDKIKHKSPESVSPETVSDKKTKYTILIVDDFETNTIVIASAFQTKGGYNVLRAKDAFEALRIVMREPNIDIVIADYNMPGQNGVELITEMRKIQRYQKIPMLILSSDTDPAKRELARKAGASGWVKKPFNLEKFLSIIKTMLN